MTNRWLSSNILFTVSSINENAFQFNRMKEQSLFTNSSIHSTLTVCDIYNIYRSRTGQAYWFFWYPCFSDENIFTVTFVMYDSLHCPQRQRQIFIFGFTNLHFSLWNVSCPLQGRQYSRPNIGLLELPPPWQGRQSSQHIMFNKYYWTPKTSEFRSYDFKTILSVFNIITGIESTFIYHKSCTTFLTEFKTSPPLHLPMLLSVF